MIASLGVGSRGNGVLGDMMRGYEDVQAVAVCDPFRSRQVSTKAADAQPEPEDPDEPRSPHEWYVIRGVRR